MSAIQTQPLEVKDFSFGITDYYIDGDPRAAEVMDNVVLTPNSKLQTRPGSIVQNTQLPLGTFRVNKLAQISGNILAFQDKRCYYDNVGAWSEVLGPTSSTFMPSGDSNAVIADSEWQGHVFFTSDSFCSPQKLYTDGAGAYQVRNAGLPNLPTGFSVTSPSGAGNNYLYAAVISYTYQVNTVTFLDRGPVFYYASTVSGGVIDSGNSVTVTIPTTFLGEENWDINNWKVEIYRTTNNGTVYYKLGQVNFGTASFVDNYPDAIVQNQEQIYITGGVYSNTTPPKAKYVHCINDYGYWAHIKEGTEILSNEVRQSKSGDPDSVPATFYANTEQPITGLSSIYDRPIVFCEKFIYRIDNYYGDDGTGGMLLRRIDDKAGCISHLSIVQTHLGIFWAGANGIYWTDGFRVECVSNHLNETFKVISENSTVSKKIVGTFDPSNQRVFWTAAYSTQDQEPDRVYILDLRFPFLPSEVKRGGTFTTMSGSTNFKPTSVRQVGTLLYRSDSRGYVFKHKNTYFTDPKIDTTKATTLWEETTILHNYSSCFLDFGSKFYRKWVPRILISASNSSNLSLAISSSNDNNRVTGDLKPIIYNGNIAWGATLPVWGDPAAIWNKQGLIEEWRRFPAGGLRCNYKQVSFTNALVKIIDSTLLGQATVNPTTKTATTNGTMEWAPGIIDYYISFSHDNYTRQYLITARTNTTITYADSSNTGPSISGNYKWVIKGKPKGEILLLNGYVIHWAFISKSHTPFSSASVGSNPA
jgi:hypothetical protein